MLESYSNPVPFALRPGTAEPRVHGLINRDPGIGTVKLTSSVTTNSSILLRESQVYAQFGMGVEVVLDVEVAVDEVVETEEVFLTLASINKNVPMTWLKK
jgi:hypothetical protein